MLGAFSNTSVSLSVSPSIAVANLFAYWWYQVLWTSLDFMSHQYMLCFWQGRGEEKPRHCFVQMSAHPSISCRLHVLLTLDKPKCLQCCGLLSLPALKDANTRGLSNSLQTSIVLCSYRILVFLSDLQAASVRVPADTWKGSLVQKRHREGPDTICCQDGKNSEPLQRWYLRVPM